MKSLPLFYPFLMLLVFPVMWLAVTGVLAHLSGWAQLAQVYPSTQTEAGEKFRYASGGVGSRKFPVRYNNCLFLTLNERGFCLSTLWLFRFQSPPFFVPWSEVRSVAPVKIFMMTRMLVKLRGSGSVILLAGPAGVAVEQAWNRWK